MDIRYLLIEIIFLVFFQNIFAQSPTNLDHTINKIYNLDFEKVPLELEFIEKANPAMAFYLRFDYLWWKMISDNSTSNESDFLKYLDSFSQNIVGHDADFERLTYFVYQIRYNNLKQQYFSRYYTVLKFHFFIGKMNGKGCESLSSFEKSIFLMTLEFDKYMKYKYLNSYAISSKKYIEECQMCLRNIENMRNGQYISFETIKTYLLGKIYFEMENDYQKAFVKFDNLSTDFPNNTIFKTIRRDCRTQFVLNSK